MPYNVFITHWFQIIWNKETYWSSSLQLEFFSESELILRFYKTELRNIISVQPVSSFSNVVLNMLNFILPLMSRQHRSLKPFFVFLHLDSYICLKTTTAKCRSKLCILWERWALWPCREFCSSTSLWWDSTWGIGRHPWPWWEVCN